MFHWNILTSIDFLGPVSIMFHHIHINCTKGQLNTIVDDAVSACSCLSSTRTLCCGLFGLFGPFMWKTLPIYRTPRSRMADLPPKVDGAQEKDSHRVAADRPLKTNSPKGSLKPKPTPTKPGEKRWTVSGVAGKALIWATHAGALDALSVAPILLGLQDDSRQWHCRYL